MFSACSCCELKIALTDSVIKKNCVLDSYKPSIDASLSYEEIGTESAKHLTENPEPESSRSIS